MRIFYIAVIVIVLAVASFFAVTDFKLPELKPISTPSATPGTSDLIHVTEPIEGQLIAGPTLMAKGEARGYWYFEASFPVKIYDANGVELGVGIAQANGEWMTENFVPFNASVAFKKPATETGTVVFERDNPSDLPGNDASVSIPVRFDLVNWPAGPKVSGGCVAAGCSGQLCVDQSESDIVTTCEYKDEYACYKTSSCERQEDGKCGWTPTEELVSCLSKAFQAETQ